MPENKLYTIGHSDRTLPAFLRLLLLNSIDVVADVRSYPYSQRVPHFSSTALKKSLKTIGIRYVFLGEELGARRTEQECYVAGLAKYDLIACLPAFQKGLDRLRAGLASYNIAILCSEKDPFTCHRAILICRHLRNECNIVHIVDDKQAMSQTDIEARLLAASDLDTRDLFRPLEERLHEAYAIHGDRIAYKSMPNEGVLEQRRWEAK